MQWRTLLTIIATVVCGLVLAGAARAAAFPKEMIMTYPSLIYFHQTEKGGHFAAWEQPELFAAELRAAFRSLRSRQGASQ